MSLIINTVYLMIIEILSNDNTLFSPLYMAFSLWQFFFYNSVNDSVTSGANIAFTFNNEG